MGLRDLRRVRAGRDSDSENSREASPCESPAVQSNLASPEEAEHNAQAQEAPAPAAEDAPANGARIHHTH